MAFKKPVSSLVLIYTEDFKVLLMERADKKGFWQSVKKSAAISDRLSLLNIWVVNATRDHSS